VREVPPKIDSENTYTATLDFTASDIIGGLHVAISNGIFLTICAPNMP
jgi:hypothetical protein